MRDGTRRTEPGVRGTMGPPGFVLGAGARLRATDAEKRCGNPGPRGLVCQKEAWHEGRHGGRFEEPPDACEVCGAAAEVHCQDPKSCAAQRERLLVVLAFDHEVDLARGQR